MNAMAPIDWDEIIKCKIEDINDDLAEYFYKQIINFNPSNEDNPKMLQKLFMVSKTVLQLKGLQAEVAMEELEQMAKNQGRLSARHEKEPLAEIEELRDELQNIKSSRRGSDSSLLKRNLRNEELEQENISLMKDIESKKTEISRAQRELEKALQLVEKNELEGSALRQEIEKLQEQLEECVKTMKNVEVSKEESSKVKEKELLAKIKLKNAEIHQLLDDVQTLENENSELRTQKSQLHEKLVEAVDQMEKNTDEYIKLKEAYDGCQSQLKLTMEHNKLLSNEIEDLKSQLSRKVEDDDEIMETVSRRVEDWKAVLKSKEVEISRQQQLIAKLQSDSNTSGLRISESHALKKIVEDRDAQIEVLREQLQLATKDLEENSRLLEELRMNKNEISVPLSPGSRLGAMIESQNELREKTLLVDKLRNKLKLVEEEWKMKDQELSDALARMRLYEMGEYGLTEAVTEIKESKNQIRIRNKQIEELTQQINESDFQLGELVEENRQLRDKIKLSPRKYDSTSFRKPESFKIHTTTQRLQGQLNDLEEENIDLRTKLHRIKRNSTKRSLSKTENDDYVKKAKNEEIPSENICTEIEESYNRSELDTILETIEKVRLENRDLRLELLNFERENKSLFMGMKEILEALRVQDGKADVVLKCPTLEQLVTAIEVREISGCYDPIWILKCQVDQLHGQNEALRGELKIVRQQTINALSKLKKAEEKARVIGVGHFSPTNSRISETPGIETVENDSISKKTDNVAASPVRSDSVDSNPSDVEMSEGEVMSTSTHVAENSANVNSLYQSILSEWEKFRNEKRLWTDEVEKEMQLRDTLKTRLEVFETLIVTLEKDENEMKQALAEFALKYSQLTCRENYLSRRLKIASEIENDLRKENEVMKKELLRVELNSLEKIKYSLRYKERAHSKVLNLQKALDDSIPSTELEIANRSFLELNANYQRLLQKQNEENRKIQELQDKEDLINKLERECETLKIDSRLLKETVKILGNQNRKDEGSLENELRMALLKEANERQRADHILSQHEQLRKAFDSVNQRNSELENKFAELTREVVEIKDRERILKEKLNESVSKEVYNALNKKVTQQEKKELILREEADRYKAALESAKYQIQTVERFREVTEKELEMSRNLLLDTQASSDEKLSAGNLYRQIIGLQLSETKLQQELNTVKQNLDQSEIRNQNLQKLCADKEDEVYNIHSQARSKIQFLTRILYELRRQFSSSISITKQEDLMKEVKNLNDENYKSRKELEKLKEEKSMIEEDKMKLTAKLQSTKELLETLKSGSPVEKIMEWHKRIEVVQMREVHAKRLAEKFSSQSDTLKELVNKLELRIVRLEEQNLRLESQLREQELETDARNLEFLETLQLNRIEVAGNVSETRNNPERVNIVDSVSQDTVEEHEVQNDLPLEEDSVLSEVLDASVSGSEVRALRESVANLEERLKEAEDALKAREDALNDLIERIPTSLNTAVPTSQSPDFHLVDYFEAKQNLSVAQTTIDCLQARVSQKEESILRYQELLNKLKDDTVSQKLHYEKELLELQSKLQSAERDYFVSKTKSVMDADDAKSLMQELNSSQLSKITELEESLDAIQKKDSALLKQLNYAQQDTVEWKIKANNLTAKLAEEKQRTKQEMYLRLQDVEERKRLEQIIQLLNRKLEEEIGSRPAQVVQLKLILKDLKNQIYAKEKQLNELIIAISKLRSEMEYLKRETIKQTDSSVTSSHSVRAHQQVQFEEPSHAETIETKIECKDQETQTFPDVKHKEFQDKIHNLEKQREALKQQVKFKDEKIIELSIELDAVRMSSDQNEEFLEKILKENDDLKKKLERVKPRSFDAPVKETNSEEVSELKQQIRYLEEQIRRHEPPEKPYIEDEKGQKSREELIRWEEGKKWQQTIDRLKSKIKDKDHEVDSLEKSNKSIREQLIKSIKEKTLLENRIKALLVKAHPSESTQVELKKQIQPLEEAGATKNGSNPDELRELKTKNKILVDKIYQLEKQLAKYTVTKETMSRATKDIFNDDPSISTAVKCNNLQKHVLKLSEENFELKVELEEVKIDIPRYKAQISTLEGLVEVLKGDIKNKEAMIEQLANGEEATIKDFRLPEHDESAEKGELSNTKHETRVTQKRGNSASIQRLFDVKTNKIVSENARLTHEVKKCQRELDQLSKRNKTLSDQNQRVLDALEDKEKLIKTLKQQIPTPHSMPPHQYKTYVVTKMYDKKISGLEEESAKFKDKYERAYKLLKEQAEKEEGFRLENYELKMKIEALEKIVVVVDSEDASSAMKSKICLLENENQELLGRLLYYEPELIKTKDRDSIYNALLKENAEMRVQLRMHELKTSHS